MCLHYFTSLYQILSAVSEYFLNNINTCLKKRKGNLNIDRMSNKRKYDNKFFERKEKRSTQDRNEKKHTLDSDEEDFVDETNVLDENDIEGEEDGK